MYVLLRRPPRAQRGASDQAALGLQNIKSRPLSAVAALPSASMAMLPTTLVQLLEGSGSTANDTVCGIVVCELRTVIVGLIGPAFVEMARSGANLNVVHNVDPQCQGVGTGRGPGPGRSTDSDTEAIRPPAGRPSRGPLAATPAGRPSRGPLAASPAPPFGRPGRRERTL